MILSLAINNNVKVNDDDDDEGEGGESELTKSIFVNLTQLFRQKLPTFIVKQPNGITKCIQDIIRSFQVTVVLNESYQSTWSVSLPCYVLLISQLVQNKEYLNLDTDTDIDTELHTSIESIIKMHTIVVAGSSEQRAINDAISALVQSIGIEQTWKYIKWTSSTDYNKSINTKKKQQVSIKKDEGISTERAWILSVMKGAGMTAQSTQPRLAFFQSDILQMARTCDAAATQEERETTTVTNAAASVVSALRNRVIDLWSLFPCFCMSPIDMNDVLPSLDSTLAKAISDKRYPQLVSIICTSITILAQKVLDEHRNEEMLPGDNNNNNVSTLELTSIKLLPAMFKYITDTKSSVTNDKLHKHDDSMNVDEKGRTLSDDANTTSTAYQYHQDVSNAISVLSRIAPKDFVFGLFKKVMHRLLEEIQSGSCDTEKVCTLLSLSQALVASKVLDETNVSFLYRAIKTMIKNDEHGSRVQKRSYKLLVEICQRYHTFVINENQLPELISLLTDTIMTAQVAARHMRLKCMLVLVEGINDSNSKELQEITKVLGEVLLCLKDANGKTREVAYQLIISMAKRGDVSNLIQVVAAALGAKTPHMRSAAVMALSRIVFECANENETLPPLLPSMLQTVLVLINEKSREVMKSVIGFIRVSVAAIPAYQLEPMVPDLVSNLLKHHEAKGRFRSKIKIILKKLVKLFDYDNLMPYVPASHARLLNHMRKLDEREKRRRLAGRNQEDKVQSDNNFDQLLDSDEDDSDDGRTLMTGATGFTRLTGRKGEKSKADKSMASAASKSTKTKNNRQVTSTEFQLPDETDGEVVDMLSAKISKRVKFAETENDDSESDDDIAMEFDDDGRLIVKEDDEDSVKAVDAHDLIPSLSNKRQRLSSDASKASAGTKGTMMKKNKNNTNNKKKVDDSIGRAYKSKKAGGDVKRKGQAYDPYAYVPLDGRAYSKKNRRATVEKMASVVRKGGKRKR